MNMCTAREWDECVGECVCVHCIQRYQINFFSLFYGNYEWIQSIKHDELNVVQCSAPDCSMHLYCINIINNKTQTKNDESTTSLVISQFVRLFYTWNRSWSFVSPSNIMTFAFCCWIEMEEKGWGRQITHRNWARFVQNNKIVIKMDNFDWMI